MHSVFESYQNDGDPAGRQSVRQKRSKDKQLLEQWRNNALGERFVNKLGEKLKPVQCSVWGQEDLGQVFFVCYCECVPVLSVSSVL